MKKALSSRDYNKHVWYTSVGRTDSSYEYVPHNNVLGDPCPVPNRLLEVQESCTPFTDRNYFATSLPLYTVTFVCAAVFPLSELYYRYVSKYDGNIL